MAQVNRFSSVTEEISRINFGDITVDPKNFAAAVQRYVVKGSSRYILSIQDLEVFANPAHDYLNKETGLLWETNGESVPLTLSGLLANGTKFLDAVFFLSLPETERPQPRVHPLPKKTAGKDQPPPIITRYDNHAEISKCMFYYFFMVLTRAKAPVADNNTAAEPVPNFLRSVLSITKSQAEVAQYLASFNLNNIDHRWVKHIDLATLSVESLNRFGLGVAGYRLAAPFKLRVPDADGHEEFAEAIGVARSIATSPPSWDIHPATRDPNILQKYGNLNKNLGNLILRVYKPETIEAFVKAKVLFAIPTEEIAYTNYTQWTLADVLNPQFNIFKH